MDRQSKGIHNLLDEFKAIFVILGLLVAFYILSAEASTEMVTFSSSAATNHRPHNQPKLHRATLRKGKLFI